VSALRALDHLVIAVPDLDAAAAAYEAAGFTLTPRAAHNDAMGTSNRLAQFENRTFLELLEVDRPDTLAPHDLRASPPAFGFGAHNRAFLKTHGAGVSMLVFTSDDADADLAAFADAGLTTYAPFRFERQAKLPDGETVTVGFSLGFVTDMVFPGLAFFVCRQHAPEHFWKPAYQRHANGARGVVDVIVTTEDPDRGARVVSILSGGAAAPVDGGFCVATRGGTVTVLRPDAVAAHAPGAPAGTGAAFAGFTLETETSPAAALSVPDPACPAFIRWVGAA
jgi:hypothetical protein